MQALPLPPVVVVMTAYADIDLAVQALRRGAFDFITKPWDNARLVAIVQAAAASRRGDRRRRPRARRRCSGDSAPMRQLRRLIASVAPTEANVLVLGEMGVGKELVAQRDPRAIGARGRPPSCRSTSARCPSPRSRANCSATAAAASPMRAATAPAASRPRTAARCSSTRSATCRWRTQAKLLTALERREVTPLGADRAEPVDVRVVSATNLDERRLFDPACFRADLLYRLNTIVLRVPPLRERREDILPLAHHYLAHYAAQYGRAARALAPRPCRRCRRTPGTATCARCAMRANAP